jgi:alanine racemase
MSNRGRESRMDFDRLSGAGAGAADPQPASAEDPLKGARPTAATIDLAALAANFAEAQRLAGAWELLAVVKADAYGHGAGAVARRLVAVGCRRLAVVTVDEAARLREAALATPILLLGGVHDPAEADDAAALHLTVAVQHAGQLPWLRRAAAERQVRIPVHVEVDTGMGRSGVSETGAVELLCQVSGEPGLHLEGVFTHFARADEPDLGPTREQLARFGRVLEEAAAKGIRPPLVHVANSAGLLAAASLADSLPATVSGARPGLLLYGARPAGHLRAGLRPVMTLRTRVAQVRRVERGDPVGYGSTWRARDSGWVATLPIGYADGVPWSASNQGAVWLRGRRAPVVGRISMDFVTVDAGPGPVEIGDEAILFGAGPPGTPSVEEAAAAAGTLPWEILVRVGARVPRVVVG